MARSSVFLFAVLFAAAVSAAELEVFTIKTLQAQMRYDVSELTITPGAQVKIVFENIDDMPHNMVFFEPGTDVVAVANKQMETPEEALKRNWLPEDPRMWLHSKLLNPKEKEEILFKAPARPGIYPFVCTFPGHAVTMQGRLKIFAPGPKLTALKFRVYLGDWKKLPNFATLTPHREGELPDNLVQLELDDYKNQFGVVFTGKLTAPRDGDYAFGIAGNDGVRLLVDGRKVVEHDGIHPATEIREGKAKLKAGEHELRVEYFQAVGEAEIYVAWRSAHFGNTPLSKWVHPQWKAGAAAKKKEESHTGIPLTVGKEPIVYRNFIAGAGNRGIAVGYPGGINIAWNAEEMNLALLWRGAFMDAARHWKSRGAGRQPPLGYDLVRPVPESTPPFAVLAAAEGEWPRLDSARRAEGYAWKGYALDAQ
ncbi:MAG: PA14 domain-containing protein, partial [Verrucomicrobiota bacterium]|nr:PA14 domain-containing protein [Verrucomicrobiota bacterium]